MLHLINLSLIQFSATFQAGDSKTIDKLKSDIENNYELFRSR